MWLMTIDMVLYSLIHPRSRWIIEQIQSRWASFFDGPCLSRIQDS